MFWELVIAVLFVFLLPLLAAELVLRRRSPQLRWQQQLAHARRDKNIWRYKRFHGHPPHHWPTGIVVYPDGRITAPMALGNAVDYASLLGGHVIEPGASLSKSASR
jgi:hypothetical protein